MPMSRVERLITSVLRHPAALAVKGWARDRWWALYGPRLRNPPVPLQLRTVLFVCKGNICRSPFAERLAARLAGERGGAIRCVSAGFEAAAEGRSPDAARAAARRFGVTLDDHRAQPLTAALMAEADLVIVNERSHVLRLQRQFPALADRVFLLPLIAPDAARGAGFRRFNIADPYGHPEPVFDECYRYIDHAVRALLGGLRGRGPEA
jgi:protein-tyrosine phosphatase